MITTKRHPLKFYFALAFGFLFLAGLGAVMFYLFFDLLNEGQIDPKTFPIPIFGLALFFMAFYLVIQYVRNSPKLTVDHNSISFGDKKFKLADIKKIILTGKIPFRFIIKFPMEGGYIKFKDGTEKYIFNDMYSNTWQIQSFLEKTVIEKQEYKDTEKIKIDPNLIKFQQTDDFKGSQWTSIRGISLWGLLGFFLLLILFNGKNFTNGFWIFLLTIGSFWFFTGSWLMHYFGLTNDYLIIKNHNPIWQHYIFRLSNIREVVFETRGNRPNCLRVITKDYRNKLYPAGTLRDNTWLEFKKNLEKNGIPVRNECI